MAQSDSPVNKSFVNIQVWDQPHEKSHSFRAQVDTSLTPLLISRHQAETLGLTIKPYSGDESVIMNEKQTKITGQIHANWNPKSEGENLSDDFYVVDDLPSDILIGKKRWGDVKDHLDTSTDHSSDTKPKEEPHTAPVATQAIPTGPWIWSVDEHKFFKIDKSSGRTRLVWKED